ncbi:hypothetical protein ACFLU1_03930 [Chloroflexota bacterium]
MYTPERADICHAYLLPFLTPHIAYAVYHPSLPYAAEETQDILMLATGQMYIKNGAENAIILASYERFIRCKRENRAAESSA